MSQKIYKNILFNQDRDKDILEFLRIQDNQSETVRNALRMYMAQISTVSSEGFTLEDVISEIREVSKQIENIKAISSDFSKTPEPQDVVNKLKNFGKF